MPQSHAARRALAAARKRGDVQARPGVATPRPAGAWPARITHAELDELGAANRITFEEGLTKAEKQTALQAAGVAPPQEG